MARMGLPAALAILLAGLTGIAVMAAEWEERTTALGAADAITPGTLLGSSLEDLVAIGEKLFAAKFTIRDGAGRPDATQAIFPTKRRHPARQAFSRTGGPDAHSCVACHNDPKPGGAGDFVTNVFASEGFSNADFDSIDPQFSNERGTNHLFGAGLIELLAREMTRDLQAIRDKALIAAAKTQSDIRLELETKGVTFGHITASPDGMVATGEFDGVDIDLVIRPFSQKGVMTSLRQFSVNAMNHHHGMQPVERFGARWTGTNDHDGDGHGDEMSSADISALVAWQATLPAPSRLKPQSAAWHKAAAKGEQLFAEWQCTTCHIPSLPLEDAIFRDPGPFDVAGTLKALPGKEGYSYDLAQLPWAKGLQRDAKGRLLVPLFGDLKRHRMTDQQVDALGNELLSQRFVGRDIFMTAELWGLASTAPYGHRNDFTTLDSIIRAHGGAGRGARDAYVDGAEEDRSALIAFLKTLVIE